MIVSETRSQYQNRQLALLRLGDLLRDGLKQSPKSRKPTKPSRGSQIRRMTSKKNRSALKKRRQNNLLEDYSI